MRSGVGSYIGSARSCGNRQESSDFEQLERTLSRSCRDHAGAARGARGDGGRAGTLGQPELAACGGRGPRARCSSKRARTIAEALGWRHDVIFTSGASEAIEIVAARAKVARPASSARPSMPIVAMRWGRVATSFRSTTTGSSTKTRWMQALADGPALVAIQQVNNETGVIQPLDRLASEIRGAGSLLLADCAQSAGKLPLPDADFIAVSRTSSAGRRDRRAACARPRACSKRCGGQEKGYRRGTAGRAGRGGLRGGAGSAGRYDMEPRCGRCGAGSRTAIRHVGGDGHRRAEPAHRRPSAPIAMPGASSASPARPVRPRRHRGFGGQRLLIGQA